MRPNKQFVEGTIERMEFLLKTADNVNELKRIQSIYFRAKYNIPTEQIADMVGWNVGTVRNLYHYYMKNGEAALRLRGRGGRFHAYLSEAEEAQFLTSFMESGKEGDILEISKIHRAYEQKVNKKVPKSTLYRLLDRHDWRKLAPRPKHPKTNVSAMEAFKKTAFPAKKAEKRASYRKLPVRLMFQDEARFGRISNPKRCWAPPHVRPQVSNQMIREYTYAYGAVSPLDGAADFLILPAMTASAMNIFLEELSRRHCHEYLLVIYDGAPCHKISALTIPKNMMIEQLPPYSPELNPVEHIWDEAREKFFKNLIFKNMDAVEDKLAEAILYFESHPKVVKSLTGFEWIINHS